MAKTKVEKDVVIDWGQANPKKWRKVSDDEEQYDDALDNDDEDVPTPAYVKELLGFDPDEFKDAEEEV